MSILFSSATERQIKALAKRIRDQVPRALGAPPITLSQALDMASRLFGHADFHAFQHYARRAKEPAVCSKPVATPSEPAEMGLLRLHPEQPFWLVSEHPRAADQPWQMVVQPDGAVAAVPYRGFTAIFAPCEVPSFARSTPPSVPQEDAEAVVGQCNLKVLGGPAEADQEDALAEEPQEELPPNSLRRRPKIITVGEALDAATVAEAIQASKQAAVVYTTVHRKDEDPQTS